VPFDEDETMEWVAGAHQLVRTDYPKISVDGIPASDSQIVTQDSPAGEGGIQCR